MPRQLETYVRTKRCKHCGHDRFYLDKSRQYRTDYCSCEGYHYRHRAKSTFCVENPQYEFNVRVGRFGEDPADVQMEIAFDRPKSPKGNDVPF